mmetsp:Transcript_5761/g.10861  ORF Transcript_5761/g.10861 Transcript_5761/m.10861 type:complete len:122 (-) Transcript_5761:310-675(-)
MWNNSEPAHSSTLLRLCDRYSGLLCATITRAGLGMLVVVSPLVVSLLVASLLVVPLGPVAVVVEMVVAILLLVVAGLVKDEAEEEEEDERLDSVVADDDVDDLKSDAVACPGKIGTNPLSD